MKKLFKKMLIVASLFVMGSADLLAQEIVTMVSEKEGKFEKTVEKQWKSQKAQSSMSEVTHLSVSGVLNAVDIAAIPTLFPNLKYLDLDQVSILRSLDLNLNNIEEIRLPEKTPVLDGGKFPHLKRVVLHSFKNLSDRCFVPQVYIKQKGQNAEVDFSNPLPANSPVFIKCDADEYRPSYVNSNIGLLIVSPEIDELLTNRQNVIYRTKDNIIILNKWREHYSRDIIEIALVMPNSYNKGLTTVKFPEITLSPNLKSLKDRVFSENQYIEKVTLPNGLITLGARAFYQSSIKEIAIPGSVSHIPDACFHKCQNLTKIILNEGLMSIGEFAFGSTPIERITLPSTVKSISADAFEQCSGLKKCELLSTTPPVIESKKSYGYEEKWKKIWKDCVVEVPEGCYDKYANAEFWKDITIVEKGNKQSALNYDLTLETPGTILSHIPLDSLHKIDSISITGVLYDSDLEIFKKCTRLSYLDISKTYIIESPQSVQSRKDSQEIIGGVIGLLGLAADANLNSGGLSSDEYLTNTMISELSKLPAQDIKANNKCFIPSYAFSEMKSLKHIKLPYRAKSIGKMAFSHCVSLRIVELPFVLESIETEAFSNCTLLQDMKFPSTLKSIKKYAFSKCSSMSEIDLRQCVFDSVFSLHALSGVGGEVFLPEGIKEINFTRGRGLDTEIHSYHFPRSLVKFYGFSFKAATNLYFLNPIPPTASTQIKNCTIYIPKGSLTSYYTSFGDANKYIEQ